MSMVEVGVAVKSGLKVPGLMSEAEMTLLARLAFRVWRPTMIVEIGSYQGRSAAVISSASLARVLAVDIWSSSPRPRYRDAYTAFVENVTTPQVLPLQMPSVRAAEIYREWFADREIGLLFIDGNHKYASVKQDFEAWSPFLAPDGTIAFHDCDPTKKYGLGVARFVKEICEQGWQISEQAESLAAVVKR